MTRWNGLTVRVRNGEMVTKLGDYHAGFSTPHTIVLNSVVKFTAGIQKRVIHKGRENMTNLKILASPKFAL